MVEELNEKLKQSPISIGTSFIDSLVSKIPQETKEDAINEAIEALNRNESSLVELIQAEGDLLFVYENGSRKLTKNAVLLIIESNLLKQGQQGEADQDQVDDLIYLIDELLGKGSASEHPLLTLLKSIPIPPSCAYEEDCCVDFLKRITPESALLLPDQIKKFCKLLNSLDPETKTTFVRFLSDEKTDIEDVVAIFFTRDLRKFIKENPDDFNQLIKPYEGDGLDQFYKRVDVFKPKALNHVALKGTAPSAAGSGAAAAEETTVASIKKRLGDDFFSAIHARLRRGDDLELKMKSFLECKKEGSHLSIYILDKIIEAGIEENLAGSIIRKILFKTTNDSAKEILTSLTKDNDLLLNKLIKAIKAITSARPNNQDDVKLVFRILSYSRVKFRTKGLEYICSDYSISQLTTNGKTLLRNLNNAAMENTTSINDNHKFAYRDLNISEQLITQYFCETTRLHEQGSSAMQTQQTSSSLSSLVSGSNAVLSALSTTSATYGSAAAAAAAASEVRPEEQQEMEGIEEQTQEQQGEKGYQDPKRTRFEDVYEIESDNNNDGEQQAALAESDFNQIFSSNSKAVKSIRDSLKKAPDKTKEAMRVLNKIIEEAKTTKDRAEKIIRSILFEKEKDSRAIFKFLTDNNDNILNQLIRFITIIKKERTDHDLGTFFTIISRSSIPKRMENLKNICSESSISTLERGGENVKTILNQFFESTKEKDSAGTAGRYLYANSKTKAQSIIDKFVEAVTQENSVGAAASAMQTQQTSSSLSSLVSGSNAVLSALSTTSTTYGSAAAAAAAAASNAMLGTTTQETEPQAMMVELLDTTQVAISQDEKFLQVVNKIIKEAKTSRDRAEQIVKSILFNKGMQYKDILNQLIENNDDLLDRLIKVIKVIKDIKINDKAGDDLNLRTFFSVLGRSLASQRMRNLKNICSESSISTLESREENVKTILNQFFESAKEKDKKNKIAYSSSKTNAQSIIDQFVKAVTQENSVGAAASGSVSFPEASAVQKEGQLETGEGSPAL